jgi:hypothetical protein
MRVFGTHGQLSLSDKNYDRAGVRNRLPSATQQKSDISRARLKMPANSAEFCPKFAKFSLDQGTLQGLQGK